MMPIPVYLLAASVAINAALGVAWRRAGDHARELQAQIAAVTGERDHALQSAQACSACKHWPKAARAKPPPRASKPRKPPPNMRAGRMPCCPRRLPCPVMTAPAPACA